jgi:hypothetical protein
MKVAAVVLSLATAGLGLAAPATARDLEGWYLRGELGTADIHGRSEWERWFAGRVGRAFGESGVFAADVGLAFSGADEGYGTATVGLEGRFAPEARVSLFVRAEAGLLAEPEFAGLVLGAGGGLAVRLTDRMALRVGVTASTHGWGEGGGGPIHAGGAFEYRW